MSTPPSTPRVPLATGGALLAIAVLTSCGPASAADPEERGFGPVGDRLTISVGGGDLTVRPADVEEVEVTRWFTGWSLIGARTAATWELAGDTLTLATDCGPVVLGRCDARYEVLVPRTVALAVEGDSGQITAAGFDTALAIGSENGAVRVEDVSGPLTLRSSSGRLHAADVRSPQVTADSENGEITLSFADAPARVDATTENGAVTVELPETGYDVTATTDNGDVRTDVTEQPGSPHVITVRTDNGGIDLRSTGHAPPGGDD
ncbi:DUF4097 family beta strand repeat-containing protein [Marinactinospora rubrisoli]|uniref:DUF4097 family beta strand repeat-containing protein n=1 Tax=Marinactinospora rubrisoli TaxID=2715399 RepID=A0ABW2KBP9_9ACTN